MMGSSRFLFFFWREEIRGEGWGCGAVVDEVLGPWGRERKKVEAILR